MGLREHLQNNRLAISLCLISLLALVTAWRRSGDQPLRPLPPPPPGPVASNALFQMKPVAANAAQGVAGLNILVTVWAANKELATAYFLAVDPTNEVEQFKRSLQLAWESIHPQLQAKAPDRLHLVVYRTQPKTLDLAPPSAKDDNVLVHGVVGRAGPSGEWPKVVSEWR